MDIKAYIESGILESYVLGLLNQQEATEVEQIKARHPEVEAEIHSIETALEKFAFAQQKTPADGLEQKIWNKIQESEQSKTNLIDFNSGEQISDNQIVGSKGFFNNYLRIAASVALLLSILGNIYLLNKYDRAKKNLDLAIQSNIDLQKDFKDQKALMPQEVDLMMNPEIKMCKLMGQKDSPSSTVMLAWNMKTNKIYLLRPNLPEPPKGKQYQLWAIMGDKPVDAGVFDMKMRMQELKETPMPKAFAVTLENTGGSQVPTSGIYVMGL